MSNNCCACPNNYRNSRNLTFHRFPKDAAKFRMWAIMCRRPDLLSVNSDIFHQKYKLCANHFIPSDFINNRLSHHAMPSIFQWTVQPKINNNNSSNDGDNNSNNINNNKLKTISMTSSTVNNEGTIPDTSILIIEVTPDIFCMDYEFPEDQSTTLKNDQSVSKCAPVKSKVLVVETQRETFNELRKKFASLKCYNSDNEFSSVEHLSSYTLCERFIKEGFANFLKIQSKLIFLIPNEHGYSCKTKQFALLLHFSGPVAYSFFQKSLCLPSLRTLKLCTKNWEITPGLNDFLFKILAVKANTMKPKSKQCVMCVGQMSVKAFLYYNFVKDEIVGFQSQGLIKNSDLSKSVTVIMIHGLNEPWKLPVSYFFSNTICTGYNLKNIIFESITRLDTITFNVKVMVSNLKKTSQVFAEQLFVTAKTPYFNVGAKEVVLIFDPIELIKITRNYFYNCRFRVKKKIIHKSHLSRFYECDKYRKCRFADKLTYNHVYPNGPQKKKVVYAAQVFSNTVVAGMTTLVHYDKLSPSAYDTIDFIDFMDKLFNIFNSRDVSNEQTTNPYRLAFSNSVFQNTFLSSMSKYFTDLEIQKFNLEKGKWVNVSREFNTRFVNSWLISIAALIRLHFNISNENQGDVQIYTHKLNGEYLDDFFRTVRAENRNGIKPTCNQFKRIFKKLFCANYFEYTEGAHCLRDLDDIIIALNKTSDKEIKLIFPENKCTEIALPIENITNYKRLNLPKQNATGCICFYLIGQCLKVHQCKICLNFAKSQFDTDLSYERFYFNFEAHYKNPALSFGNLIMYNSTFYQYILKLDLTFNKHFNLLAPYCFNVGKTIKNYLLNSISFYHPCNNFPKHFLINLFVRLRIYNNLHMINKDNQILHTGRKIKIS